MSASFVGSTTGASGSKTVTVPTGVQLGDLLVVSASQLSPGTDAWALSTFTRLLTLGSNTVVGPPNLGVLAKLADSNDAAGGMTYSFGVSQAVSRNFCLAYRGIVTATPDGSNIQTGLTAASLTPSVLDDLELYIATINNDFNDASYVVPAGFTQRASVVDAFLGAYLIGDLLDYASTNPTGTRAATGTGGRGAFISAHLLFQTQFAVIPRNPAINHQNPAVV